MHLLHAYDQRHAYLTDTAPQVNTQYPNSVASKNLNNWSGLLFDLQAIPKARSRTLCYCARASCGS